MKALDIFLHHSRFGHTGPDDGTGSHQGEVIVASEFFKQAAHGGTFDIKTSDCFAVLQAIIYLFILFKFGTA